MPIKIQSNDAHLPTSNSASTASQPPAIAAELTDRYQLFAAFFEKLHLEKEVYAFEDRVVLRWPRKLEAPADYNVRLQLSDGRIFAEAAGQEGDSGDRTLAQAQSIPDGEYELILMPSVNEYYVKGVRVQRKIPLSVVRSDYRTAPYDRYVDRQIELLRHAITQDDGLFSEIAKMTLGWWSRINAQRLAASIGAMAADGRPDERGEENHLARLIGLLGMVSRHGENEAFPAEIRQPLDDCMIGFVYDERAYAGNRGVGKGLSSTERLLLGVCEMLAGQRYPQRTFVNSNRSGQWHQEQGEAAVLRWLKRAATHGFPETSSHSMAQLLIALSHLIDLADSEKIWDLAGVVMDKALVTLALDSYQGFYGAGLGAAAAGEPTVRSGYLSPLSGVGRLLWGLGAWNQHLAAPVSLACCPEYEQPALIAALASETLPAAMWASERHAIAERSEGTSPAPRERTLHKAIYKTPDFLLSCAQDFQPGQRGRGEQSWQATLGAEATVFVNHPGADAAASKESAFPSSYWRSGLLPRVAQYHDLLIALYALPAEDPFGFTRAYFPTAAFDEQQVGIRDTWAFAAKGDAYIALACSHPIELVQQGMGAYRELRAYGHEVAWLCQMGRKADYGSFVDFRKRMLASRFDCEGFAVSYRQFQGDNVTFDWDGPLCVNDEAQPLQSANHYDGPHCVTDGWPASQMVIVHGEQALQLHFSS